MSVPDAGASEATGKFSEPYRLGIDFGTSNTAAAYCRGDSEPVGVKLSDLGSVMPSAVCVDEDGWILVGQTAINNAHVDLSAFEPSPKRLIGEEDVFIGGRVRAVTDLIAGVMQKVLTKARQQVGHDFSEVVLTHPDQWGKARRRVLRIAAGAAGIAPEQLRFVSEPHAAAWYYTYRNQHEIPVGGRMCVFDFGAGTLDVAVLEKRGEAKFKLMYHHGDNGLGGLNFDERILGWVRDQLKDRPELLAAVEDPDNRLVVMERIKDAKEELSDSPRTNIVIPGEIRDEQGTILLTREDFNELIRRDVQAAVQLTKLTLEQAGVAENDTLIIYLTGGTSSIPLVQTELAQLGRIERVGDPKTVVAQGALVTPELLTARATLIADVPTRRPVVPPPPTTSRRPIVAPPPLSSSRRPVAVPPPGTGQRQIVMPPPGTGQRPIVVPPLSTGTRRTVPPPPSSTDSGRLVAGHIVEMPRFEPDVGIVSRIWVTPGQLVRPGDALLEVASGNVTRMVSTPVPGTVRDLNVGISTTVCGGHLLCVVAGPDVPAHDFPRLPRVLAPVINVPIASPPPPTASDSGLGKIAKKFRGPR